MAITRLSSKGQVIIPKPIREARQWKIGQQLEVVETEEGILIRPVKPFDETELEEVVGCIKYDGPSVSIDEMNGGIALKRRLAHDRD